MANMTLRLPDELDSQLKAQARDLGISKHQMIIDLLVVGLGGQLDNLEKPIVTLDALQTQINQLQVQVDFLASQVKA